jgi:hypothetical protein
MSTQPADTTGPAPIDPIVEAAIQEEQELLGRAVLEAQARYLLDRCITLNVERRRASD